jgi:uncharacterized protein (UPF0335 family)
MDLGHNGGHAGALLVEFVESVEKLEEEKRLVAEQIRETKARARRAGFDVKVLNQMLRERRMSALERQDFQSLCELYRAALGMLNGTPLGEAARKRLMGELPAEPEETPPAEASAQAPGELGKDELETARAAGREAAREGKRIVDNPYLSDDPRRAAWDEGWCAETGTDGMEVPEAWRRRKPKGKPDESEGASADPKPDGDDGDGGAQ